MSLLKTSNPIFTPYFWEDNQASQSKMTVYGIVIKTVAMLFITSTITLLIWKLNAYGTNIKWYGTGGMLAAIVISIVLSFRQQ